MKLDQYEQNEILEIFQDNIIAALENLNIAKLDFYKLRDNEKTELTGISGEEYGKISNVELFQKYLNSRKPPVVKKIGLVCDEEYLFDLTMNLTLRINKNGIANFILEKTNGVNEVRYFDDLVGHMSSEQTEKIKSLLTVICDLPNNLIEEMKQQIKERKPEPEILIISEISSLKF